jgi:6-pyruvoyltetrahydropterin/6-carboxytetrahydropterin synthase
MTDVPLKFQSSKTYTHSVGLSCCFRQWRATHSHCSKLHGYALKVELIWEGELDERNWVMDFGGLKKVKQFLEATFDHKTLIARDDPQRMYFERLAELEIIDLVMLSAVGAEKFAEYIFRVVDDMFERSPSQPHWPLLQSVQVWEHEGNSAKVIRDESSIPLQTLADELTNVAQQLEVIRNVNNR